MMNASSAPGMLTSVNATVPDVGRIQWTMLKPCVQRCSPEVRCVSKRALPSLLGLLRVPLGSLWRGPLLSSLANPLYV